MLNQRDRLLVCLDHGEVTPDNNAEIRGTPYLFPLAVDEQERQASALFYSLIKNRLSPTSLNLTGVAGPERGVLVIPISS